MTKTKGGIYTEKSWMEIFVPTVFCILDPLLVFLLPCDSGLKESINRPDYMWTIVNEPDLLLLIRILYSAHIHMLYNSTPSMG